MRITRGLTGAVAGIAASALVVTLAATTPTQASPNAATSPLATPGATAALSNQVLDWAECYPGEGYPELECAAMTVPRNWSRPKGPTLTIAVSRIAASDPDARRGVLFTNPGGPGGSGLTLPLFLESAEPDVAATYDLIGMDPRGVADSTVLDCADTSILDELYNLDGRDTSFANQARIIGLDKKYAKTCTKDPLTPYITTEQTVHDFDLLRALLHERTINYLGYSFGTWLGTWYAADFPNRVDRFVLDGNVDFTSDSYDSAYRQPKGFQVSWDKWFVPWIAKYDSLYDLGSTSKAVRRTYEKRRAALAAHPLTLDDGSQLTASGYDSGISGMLYWTGLYEDGAAALSAIEHYSTATQEEKDLVVGFFGAYDLTSDNVFWTTTCQDDGSPSLRRIQSDTRHFRRTAPLIGSNWNVYPCVFWSIPPQHSPVKGWKLPKLLMLNNDADPATPLGNALTAFSNTPRAKLVTVKGQPDHTIYGNGDECVETITNRWLLDGVLPHKRLSSCPGLPLPDPTEAAAVARTSGSAKVASGDQALAWTERFVARHGQAHVG